MAVPLRLYFDFISPYAYLGWSRARELATELGLTLEPQPVLFAAMLNAYGHKGPAEIPPKRSYTWKHIVRLSHDLGLPVRLPPAHPFNPLLGLRVATAMRQRAGSGQAAPDAFEGVIDRLFELVWREEKDITNPELVAQSLNEMGLDGHGLVSEASSPDVKGLLTETTQSAIEFGVFGVPSFEVNGELFWGQDSLPHLAAFVQGRDPVSNEELAKWENLPVGSSRR